MPASNETVEALAQANPSLHRHLFGKQPKRMLALDGGGVLGVIEIAFLEQIEQVLRDRARNPRLVLSDYFDLIGGTSTGAIIATALALGMSANEVKKLYFDFGPAIFKRPLLSAPGFAPQFNAQPLAAKLKGVLGDRELQSADLRTGLAIVAKRVDTGSPWVITNNPLSKYWEDVAPDRAKGTNGHIGNKRYLLRDLVRASSAAPFFFKPAELQIVEGEKPGWFVDGGMSPHNNPALQLLMLAGIKAYGFHWPVGKDDLLLISCGCGWVRPRIPGGSAARMPAAELAIKTLRSLIWDAHVNTMQILQWISEPRLPWEINSEVGTLSGETLGSDRDGGEMLRFQRYDIKLEPKWLKEWTGEVLTDAEAEKLNNFVDPAIMDRVYQLAHTCATKQVMAEDFPPLFDPR